jgi:CHASE3 domain sensor protein
MKSILKQSLALFLFIPPVLLTSLAFSYSSEEKSAYNYAFRNNITTMDSIDSADM